MVVAEKVKIGWPKIIDMIDILCDKLKDEKFDRVVGISRGGLIPGVIISHRFNLPFSAVGVSSYNDTTCEQESLICDTPEEVFKGWKGSIVLVDDLVDSGRSMRFLLDKIENNSNITKISIATLFYKETSIIKPDYFVETTDKWILFSWEDNKEIA